MTTITMKEVAAFLLGEAPLDGFWFGERHPAGGFWWREHLRAALAAPATAQAAEIERLKTESEERLQNCAALVAENERLRKDAARYQWLKKHPQWLGWEHDFRPDEVEREIDAAMKETP